ncbi:MAG: hypothetical protein AAB803_00715 [Patescibacteria group bacterium]
MVDPGKVEGGRIIIEGQYGTYVSTRVPDPVKEGDTDQIDPGETQERPVTSQGE